MRKLIAFAVLLGYLRASHAQNISITVSLPHAYVLTDSVLYIEVFVFSANPVSGVTANVLGRQTFLKQDNYGYPPSYGGTILLVGLPQDTLNVQIVATDNQNNQATVNQPFIYDRAPVLVVDSPLSWSVASPLLHIKARCIDTAGCNLSVSGDGGAGIKYNVIYLGNSIDSTIDLSGNEGGAGHITINAYDKRRQNSYVSKQIFVENNSHLEQVFAAGDQILDYNFNRLFVSNPSWGRRYFETDLNFYVHRSRIVNVITGDSIAIPYEGPLSGSLEFNPAQNHILTRYGAIFSAVDTNTYLSSLFDLHSDALDSLGPLNSNVSLRVAGNYAIWSNAATLFLRQLNTTTNTIISSSAVNFRNDISAGGFVTYAGSDCNIYRYANNSSTAITNGPVNKCNYYPVADGSNVIYTSSDPCCTNQHYSLRLYNGISDSLLSDMDTIEPSPLSNYQLNNGYIAYTKPDSVFHLQIWLRDTSGASRQVTSSAGNSTIDVLSPNGDLTFFRTTGPLTRQRFFANASTGQQTDLGTANGQVYYRDSAWYLVLGRILYKIDSGLYTHRPADPQISGLNRTYCSTQGLQKIQLVNFPDASTLVTVELDNARLPVGPDSSVSFNVGDLTAGKHAIEIIYSNAAGSRALIDSFDVIAAVVPIVKLSSNISTVTNLVDSVLITATNVAGGGSDPLYTFGGDRNFSAILQPESANSELSINPATLAVGTNTVFVRMVTSDSCYITSTGLDSLELIRNAITGIVDPDFPNQPISTFPNPFDQVITAGGFQRVKTYLVSVRNNLGELIYQRELSNSNMLTLSGIAVPAGIYYLSIYDYKKSKLLGTLGIYKK